MYDHELSVAIEAVAQAAELCRAVRSGATPESLSKKDKSPVTVADFGSQLLVSSFIFGQFDDPLIAEEDSSTFRAGDVRLQEEALRFVREWVPHMSFASACHLLDLGNNSGYVPRFWTLDPIDGTKGFLRNDQYAVALALIVDGQPAVAALACPNLDGGMIFSAVRGGGAFCRRMEPAECDTPIHVTTTADPRAARFCESVESGHSAHDAAATVASNLGITAEPIRMDSQCKYGVVARGGADIYLRLPTRGDYVERIWDHAAGALIVTEAGGRVTDITGKPLDFTHGRGLEANRGVVATNGSLHDRVLGALAATGIR